MQLQSEGYEDVGFNPEFRNNSYIIINDVKLQIHDFPREPLSNFSSNLRGIAMVTFDTTGNGCQVIPLASKVFDTYGNISAAYSLSEHLHSLPPGTMVAGVCIDECRRFIEPAVDILSQYGVSICGNGSADNVWFRGAFAFIAFKNMSRNVQMTQTTRTRGPARLNKVYGR